MKNIKCLSYDVLLKCLKLALFKEKLTTFDLKFISDVKDAIELTSKPYWIDETDYLPSADGFGNDPTEPRWNYKCSLCEHHVFDEDPPEECPGCKANMSCVSRR